MTHPDQAEPDLVRGGGWTVVPDRVPDRSAQTGLTGAVGRFLFGEPGPDGRVIVLRRQVARLTLAAGALLAVIVVAVALVVQAASPDRDSAITGEANQVPAWVWAPGDGSENSSPTPSGTPTEAPTPTVPPESEYPSGGSAPDPGAPSVPTTSAAAPAPAPTPTELRSNTRRSLRLASTSDRYVRYRDGLAFVDRVTGTSPAGTRQQATFTVVTGLADRDCYSFRGGDGRYLRHFDFRIRYDEDDRSDLFERDATFCPRSFGRDSGVIVLESDNYRGRFIRHRDGGLFLDSYQNSPDFAASVLFQVTTAWS